MVLGHQPLPLIKAAMAEVQSEASTLKSNVDGISGQINAASSQVFGYFGQLAQIESDLTTQMTTLRGQLDDAEIEEQAVHKRYLYLLLLGPFGLVGLAVALGLYYKWRGEANGYASQVSSLNAQIHSFNAMKGACQLMGSDLRGVVTKIAGVNNSVAILDGDIVNIESDLGNLALMTIYVQAAITEVTTLGIDAS